MTEARLASLEKKVERLDRLAWLLGALAVIFGLSGAFGYKMIASAKERLEVVERDLASAEERLKNARSDHEAALLALVSEQQSNLERHAAELSAGLLTAKLQAGTEPIGGSLRSPTPRAPVRFPRPFSSPPRVVATPLGGDHPDVFAVTVLGVTAHGFTAQVHRVDHGNSYWRQPLLLNWIAIEEEE